MYSMALNELGDNFRITCENSLPQNHALIDLVLLKCGFNLLQDHVLEYFSPLLQQHKVTKCTLC